MRYEVKKGIHQDKPVEISEPVEFLLFDILMELRRFHKTLKAKQGKQNGGENTGGTGNDQI